MSSKTDFTVKLILVLFITLLSFSIGTYVGKQYSDNQHKLSQLEPNSKSGHGSEASREIASAHEEEGATKKSTMSDDDIAKLAEEFVADETESPAKDAHGDAHSEKGHDKKDAHADNGHDKKDAISNDHEKKSEKEEKKVVSHTEEKHGDSESKHEKAATKAVAHEKADTHANKQEHKPMAEPSSKAAELAESSHVAAPKKERAPTSLPKNVAQYTVGKFTVQVASYANEDEAQKLATDLKKKGYSAFYIPAAIKGNTWYRVSVGQFATQKEAQSYRSELLEKAKVDSAIVQKISE